MQARGGQLLVGLQTRDQFLRHQSAYGERIAAPTVYHAEDAMECWRKITAPVQLQGAEHGLIRQRFGGDPAEFSRRAGCFQNLTQVTVEDSGHNVQHDQPEQVAAHLEAFLTRD